MRLVLFGCLLLLACRPTPPTAPNTPRATEGPSAAESKAADRRAGGATAQRAEAPPLAGGIRTELVADGLQLPANLTFAPDGRLFLTEVLLGRVRVIDHGSLLPEPFYEVGESARKEAGLLGLALDPDFARNHHVYLYYSQPKPEKTRPWRNRVVRLTDAGGVGTDLRVVLDDLPISNWRNNGGHDGGRLAFGPEGKLFVTVGDVGDSVSSQDMGKLSGKLLRINPDGSVPPDNPVPDSPIFASGLRNAWGLGFHPLTGVPYVTDNGGTHHDEVNRIQPGGNYGWPKIQGMKGDARFLDPIWDSGTERGGVTGLTFYTGQLFPQYTNDLLFCRFTNSRLMRLHLGGPNFGRVEREERLSDQCALDVATGPEGAIYISWFDRVLRLVPDR